MKSAKIADAYQWNCLEMTANRSEKGNEAHLNLQWNSVASAVVVQSYKKVLFNLPPSIK